MDERSKDFYFFLRKELGKKIESKRLTGIQKREYENEEERAVVVEIQGKFDLLLNEFLQYPLSPHFLIPASEPLRYSTAKVY